MLSIRTMLVCLMAAISAQPLAADLAVPITRVQEIRQLSRADASKQLPVRFKGVVIWQDTGSKPSIFVHDGHASIWVDRATSNRRDV
jgi:hypothetical protein